MKSKVIQLGTLVRVNRSFLGEPEGVRALVYEEYGQGGRSVITQNGVDLGGFSATEVEDYLEFEAQTDLRYEFRNVLQLTEDWRAGIFEDVFEQP